MQSDTALKRALKSQYHASLAMLRAAVEQCPADLWYDATPTNAFWQVAYHTLFFAHLYLQRDEAAFQPWPGEQRNVQHPDGIPGPANPESALPLIPAPYSKPQVLEYWAVCDGIVDTAVNALDLDSPESGFHRYPIPKLEHQLVNLRHIQHHTAQLADRLRAHCDIGIDWVGASRTPPA